jgi:hypothetical protein
MMDSTAKAANTSLLAPLITDVVQTFGATAESGLASAKEAIEKLNVVMAEHLLLIRDSYSTVFRTAPDYNIKLTESHIPTAKLPLTLLKV